MIKQKLLTKNKWSRPARKLNPVKAITLHWTAGPRDTPEGVFSWFENRKKGKTGYGSAHYCVGMDGHILQFLPDEELAYHVGSKTYTDYGLSLSSYPNNCTIGIEMCPINIEGEFTDDTLKATKELTALLLMEHNLKIENITTHQAIVGWKDCPRWFVRFPDELKKFKEEVDDLIKNRIKGKVLSQKLNVRSEPRGKKIDTITKGKNVNLVGIKNGWYKVSYNNTIGYCNSKYIG